MKKLIPILSLAFIISIFSSCILLLQTHTMYFYNDTTNQYVYDWYLKDEYGTNHTLGDEYCEVPPGTYSSKSGLTDKLYQVWFCVYSSKYADYYVHTEDYVRMDTDTTFRLKTESFHYGSPRSATFDNTPTEETFILEDSNGNKYPLEVEVINK